MMTAGLNSTSCVLPLRRAKSRGQHQHPFAEVDDLFDLLAICLPRSELFQEDVPKAVYSAVRPVALEDSCVAVEVRVKGEGCARAQSRPLLIVAEELRQVHIRTKQEPPDQLHVLLRNPPSPGPFHSPWLTTGDSS